jgi:uncharacterized protein
MNHFTPLASCLGGVLIGLAASLLLFGIGRIAGVSGMLAGLVLPAEGERGFRAAFVLGLVGGGAAMFAVAPGVFELALSRSLWWVAAAGLLVGFGTRMSGGCTSGHGVCGVSRLSPRSLLATLTFMATGALTVYVVRHVLGGAS